MIQNYMTKLDNDLPELMNNDTILINYSDLTFIFDQNKYN